jgi:hypothetical protein
MTARPNDWIMLASARSSTSAGATPPCPTGWVLAADAALNTDTSQPNRIVQGPDAVASSGR